LIARHFNNFCNYIGFVFSVNNLVSSFDVFDTCKWPSAKKLDIIVTSSLLALIDFKHNNFSNLLKLSLLKVVIFYWFFLNWHFVFHIFHHARFKYDYDGISGDLVKFYNHFIWSLHCILVIWKPVESLLVSSLHSAELYLVPLRLITVPGLNPVSSSNCTYILIDWYTPHSLSVLNSSRRYQSIYWTFKPMRSKHKVQRLIILIMFLPQPVPEVCLQLVFLA